MSDTAESLEESESPPPESSTSPPPTPTSKASSPPPSDSSTDQSLDFIARLEADTSSSSSSASPPNSESPPPASPPPPPTLPPPSSSPPPPPPPASPPPADSDPPKPAPVPPPPPSHSNTTTPPPPAPIVVSSPPSPIKTAPPPAPTKTAPPPAPTKTPPPPAPTQTAPPPAPTQTPPPPSATPPPSPHPPPPPPPPPPAQPLPTPPATVISPPVSLSPPPVAIPPPTLPSIPQTPPTPITTPTPSVPSTPTPLNDVSPPTSTSSGVPPPPSSHRVPSSHTPPRNSSSGKSSPSSKSSNTGPVVGVTVAGAVILALVAIFFVVSRRKKKQSGVIPAKYKPPPGSYPVNSNGNYYGQQQPMGMSGTYGSQHSANGNNHGSQRGQMYYPGGPESNGGIGSAKSSFSYEEIMEITNGFSRQNIIGEGGFGYVFKGWLPDGKAVAVKQLKAGSGQGEREFRAEVEIISRVHHRHLVSLVGYSIAENQRLLLYEFLPNNTLEHHLHGQGLPVLEWSKRLKISIGSARGLAYLHEDCNPRIIHRDIKSANILLDDDFEAQVADFGLAKPSNDMNTHVSTRVMGTFGYMAPEYASSGKLTDRSDVFSFGVVLLELITGRKPVDTTQPLGDESLVEWARPLLIHALETGDVSELIDPRLERRYVESEMLRMIETAAACVRHSAPKRPRMAKVVRALDMEGEFTDLSNGVKYGQSTIYDSGQYNQEIQRFRKMAFGDDSSDYDMDSGEYHSREISVGAPTSTILTDSETRAMNHK